MVIETISVGSSRQNFNIFFVKIFLIYCLIAVIFGSILCLLNCTEKIKKYFHSMQFNVMHTRFSSHSMNSKKNYLCMCSVVNYSSIDDDLYEFYFCAKRKIFSLNDKKAIERTAIDVGKKYSQQKEKQQERQKIIINFPSKKNRQDADDQYKQLFHFSHRI